MSFNVKYHVQAEQELLRRKAANDKKRKVRRAEMDARFPEFVQLRALMATAGAKIAGVVLDGGDPETASAKIEEIRQENVAAVVRMKELLMNAGKPHDYLDPIYSCPMCQDTGVTQYARCECYNNAVKRFASAEINASTHLTLTGFDTFNVTYQPDEVRIDIGNVREITQDNFHFCEKYAEDFHLPNPGILMTGGTGLGKTHLSLAIAGKVLSKGYNVVYGSAPDFFAKVHDEHYGREVGHTMKLLQAAELLIMDDIGTEYDTSFYVLTFYNILNSRMNAGKPTIISTNLNTNEQELRYGNRITSRFIMMEILEFHGDDIRQKNWST
ncbi:MAG: ATP-binding protein [Oscillospiraceae bacterium]|nr:ATP-binding protein [Oscillospiraceae bacterium]